MIQGVHVIRIHVQNRKKQFTAMIQGVHGIRIHA